MGICGPSDQDGRWASTRMVHESQKWLRAVHVALSRGYPLLGSEEALGERAPLSIPGGCRVGFVGRHSSGLHRSGTPWLLREVGSRFKGTLYQPETQVHST